MKTFAYLALAATAIAVRLTSDDVTDADAATEQEKLETLAAEGGLDAIRGSDLGDDAAECLLKAVDGELEKGGVPKKDRREVAKALKEGREEDKSLGDAEDFLRELGREAGADDADIDAALERAGEGALKCLKEKKEKKEKPADDDGADEQVAGALAQDDAVDLDDVEEVVEAVAEMDEGEKEELVARVKEEGKGDEVMDALRKAVQEATGEQKEALKEMVEKLVGEKPAGGRGEKK